MIQVVNSTMKQMDDEFEMAVDELLRMLGQAKFMVRAIKCFAKIDQQNYSWFVVKVAACYNFQDIQTYLSNITCVLIGLLAS